MMLAPTLAVHVAAASWVAPPWMQPELAAPAAVLAAAPGVAALCAVVGLDCAAFRGVCEPLSAHGRAEDPWAVVALQVELADAGAEHCCRWLRP